MREFDIVAAQNAALNRAESATPFGAHNGFDFSTARFLAGASAAAYADDAGQDWFGARGLQAAILEAAATDTRVIVGCDGEDCVAAFRGTEDLRNWLTDLDCDLIRQDAALLGRACEGQVRVHRGFHAALGSVWEELSRAIAGAEGRRVWLTGHSLGGALAMLAAHRLPAVAGVYTFGQPRVGDAAFRDAYNAALKERTFRIVHADDLVPRIPWLLGRYRHAGHEVFFPVCSAGFSLSERAKARTTYLSERAEARTTYLLDPPWWRKLPCDLAGLSSECMQGKLALLADHHVNTYLQLFSTH